MTNTVSVLSAKTGVKITKLPPGEALGARDMQHWAERRMKGQSGVPPTRQELKRLGKTRKLDAADRWLREQERKGRRRRNFYRP